MESLVARELCPAQHRGRVHRPLIERLGSADPADHLDLVEVQTFPEQLYAETSPTIPLPERREQVRAEIVATGTYTHTVEELEFGGRVAWCNSARCIGRLYWKSLRIRDLRTVRAPADVAREEAEGRRRPADWSWIVPPLSGGLTPVYHRYYDEPERGTTPSFLPPTPVVEHVPDALAVPD